MKGIMIADSHCHLTLYPKEDIQKIIEEARKNNINILHTIATSLQEYEELMRICSEYKGIYCSIGIHPNNITETDANCGERIIELAKHEKVISIGETGLDYYRKPDLNEAQKQLQQLVFKEHIKAAIRLKLPLVIHAREADEDVARILIANIKNKEVPVILHSFASGRSLFEAALQEGWYVSFSGIVTFNNAKEIQQIAKKTPKDRLLIETDAPYLAPTPMRGKKNYPHFINYTMGFLKTLRADPNLDEAIMENFMRVFKKVSAKSNL